MIKQEKWHRWFAWHPIRVKGKLTWLKIVERKGAPYCWEGIGYNDVEGWHYSYRDAHRRWSDYF